MEHDPRALREEILGDVGELLRERLAADEWGRLLVRVQRTSDGTWAIASTDVEEIVGDEGRVDAAWGDPDVPGLLPVLAKATEALAAIDGADLELVGGGTFVRVPGKGFVWLPGLVKTPSYAFDRRVDEALTALRGKNDRLKQQFGIGAGDRVDVDVGAEEIRFETPVGKVVARATVIGSFSPVSLTWAWGGSNRSLPEGAKRAAAALVDEILDRSMWEISTPQFASEPGTAWGLAAVVCEAAGGDGVYRLGGERVVTYFLLRGVRLAVEV